MAPALPLSTLLSHALVAFAIELDNEFERRLHESGQAPRVASFVMWTNFLRFVGDGITVAELPAAAGIPKPRTLSTLGGMERWGYVSAGPERKTRRDGFGSARGLRPDWVVRSTPAGRAAAAIWQPLADEIEERWAARFGAPALDELRGCLEALPEQLELPQYVPIVGGGNWKLADAISSGTREAESRLPLSALLSRALLAYTLEFERDSALALPLAANVVRVLEESGVPMSEVPQRGGISQEGVAIAMTALKKGGYVAVEEKTVRLTARGREAQERSQRLHAEVEPWPPPLSGRLRAALDVILDRPELLAVGLRPHAGGWRGTKPYLAQTEAMLDNPTGVLPHYPMVLHRGGWPDGS